MCGHYHNADTNDDHNHNHDDIDADDHDDGGAGRCLLPAGRRTIYVVLRGYGRRVR